MHWFDKVEMFVFCRPRGRRGRARSGCWSWEKEFLDSLELPYRVIDVATGDLGSSAARKFDCEAWIPTQGTLPRAHLDVELHRRSRPAGSTSASATRDGTAARSPRSTARWCAITRTIVAILENHQQADGSVHVPAALQPYLGGLTTLEPPA